MKKIILYFLFSTLAIAHIANSAESKLLYTIGTASLFDKTDDLAIDGLEQSYILSKSKNTVYKIDTQGKQSKNWQLNTPANHIITNLLNSPSANLYTLGYASECPNGICKSLISKWSPEGQLINQWQPLKPRISKIVISGNNQIIVSTINKIFIYSDSGTLIREIIGFSSPSQPSGIQPFLNIKNLAINSKNELLVVDYNRKRLTVINLEGKLLKEPIYSNLVIDSGKTNSHSLAYDTQGFIYDSQSDANYNNTNSCNCVRKFDSQGKLVKTIGGLGSEKGQFIAPKFIALSKSNNLFVADSGNFRLQKISTLANPIWTAGDSLGSFKHSNGLVADSKNNLYVLDPGHYRVQKFSNSGKVLISWGGFGKTDGKFVELTQITIDKDEKIYIQDSYVDSATQQKKKRIQTFSTEGVFLGTYDAAWPSFDKEGNSYAIIKKTNAQTNNTGYFIQKTDTQSHTQEWPLNYENTSDYTGYIITKPCLESLAVDTQGNIYTLKCSNRQFFWDPRHTNYESQLDLLKINPETGLMTKETLNYIISPFDYASFTTSLAANEKNMIFVNNYVLDEDYGFPPKLSSFNNELELIGQYPVNAARFVYTESDKVYTINYDTDIIEVYSSSTLLKAPIINKLESLTTTGAVRLKWQDRTNDETGFNIYRCKIVDTACTDFKLVKTTQANVTGTRLPAPTDFSAPSSYTYKVTTIKNEEESLASNSMTVSF